MTQRLFLMPPALLLLSPLFAQAGETTLAGGQEPPTPGKVAQELATAASDAAGFAAIGKSASEITNPGTAKQFALGLLNGMDQNGNFASGLAFQFSPYVMLNADKLNAMNNRNIYAENELLARFNLIMSTAKAADGDKGIYATIGAMWTPIADDDPYGSHGIRACVDAVTHDASDSSDPEKVIQKCHDDYKNKDKLNVQIVVIAYRNKTSFRNLIAEKNRAAPIGFEPPASFARLVGIVGACILASFLWAYGLLILYSFAKADLYLGSTRENPVSKAAAFAAEAKYFIYISAALFAPYAANQLSRILPAPKEAAATTDLESIETWVHSAD